MSQDLSTISVGVFIFSEVGSCITCPGWTTGQISSFGISPLSLAHAEFAIENTSHLVRFGIAFRIADITPSHFRMMTLLMSPMELSIMFYFTNMACNTQNMVPARTVDTGSVSTHARRIDLIVPPWSQFLPCSCAIVPATPDDMI